MNLATLTWELLDNDHQRMMRLPPAKRASLALWQAAGEPMATFLRSAASLHDAHRTTITDLFGLLVDLGLDVDSLQHRLQKILPDRPQGAEAMLEAIADGTIEAAAAADQWDWVGIRGVDLNLISTNDLLSTNRSGQQLLRWIAVQDEAPSLTEVLSRLQHLRGSGLILRWATQTFALVPGYCPRRNLPTLGQPASALTQRHRDPPVRPTAQPPAAGVRSTTLVEDLTAVLAEIALQPVRHRQDWVWRVADAKRVAARLPGGEHDMARLALTFEVCQFLGLTHQIAMETRVSDAGKGWLPLSTGQRQHRTLEQLRPFLYPQPDGPRRDDHHGARLLERIMRRHLATAECLLLWTRLAAAWRELADETWLLSQALTWWRRHPPQGIGLHAESAWAEGLDLATRQLAIPLGMLSLQGERAKTTISLSPAGRWAVGLETAWTPPTESVLAKPVIVQADHTIIFLAPDAPTEIAFGAFCDRLPGAHGTGALFKLSKTACRRAAIAGLDAAQVVAVLSAASAKPLPANVLRELDGWFSRLRRAVAQTALLITTTDAETATTLVAMLGATRVGPQAVSLPLGTRPGELERRLAKDGILLDTSSIVRRR